MNVVDLLGSLSFVPPSADSVTFAPRTVNDYLRSLFQAGRERRPQADYLLASVLHMAIQELSAKSAAHDVHFVQIGCAPGDYDTFEAATRNVSYGLRSHYVNESGAPLPERARGEEERAASAFEREDLRGIGLAEGARVTSLEAGPEAGVDAFIRDNAIHIGVLAISAARGGDWVADAVRRLRPRLERLHCALIHGVGETLDAVADQLPGLFAGPMEVARAHLPPPLPSFLIIRSPDASWTSARAPLRDGLETYEPKLSGRPHTPAPVIDAAETYPPQCSLVLGFRRDRRDAACVLHRPETLTSFSNIAFTTEVENDYAMTAPEFRFETRPTAVVYLQNAKVYGDVVIDGAGNVVADVSELVGVRNEGGRRLLDVDLAVDVRLEGVWADLRTYYPNHSHWMMESLRRLRFFDRMGVKPNLLLYDTVTRSQREYFDVLGYGGVRTFDRRRDQVIQCEELLSVGQDIFTFDRTSAEYFERVAEAVPADESSTFIYVARTDATAYRNMINEEAVIRACEERGFRIVVPSELTAREKIAIFKGASLIVGPLGAGLLYSVFSRRGIDILTMTSRHYLNKTFASLSVAKGFNVIYQLGVPVESYSWIWDNHHCNFFADVEKTRRLLDVIMRRRG